MTRSRPVVPSRNRYQESVDTVLHQTDVLEVVPSVVGSVDTYVYQPVTFQQLLRLRALHVKAQGLPPLVKLMKLPHKDLTPSCFPE